MPDRAAVRSAPEGGPKSGQSAIRYRAMFRATLLAGRPGRECSSGRSPRRSRVPRARWPGIQRASCSLGHVGLFTRELRPRTLRICAALCDRLPFVRPLHEGSRSQPPDVSTAPAGLRFLHFGAADADPRPEPPPEVASPLRTDLIAGARPPRSSRRSPLAAGRFPDSHSPDPTADRNMPDLFGQPGHRRLPSKEG